MTGWSRPAVVVTFAAAAVLMVTMGARNTLGLFVSPINSSTGHAFADITAPGGAHSQRPGSKRKNAKRV